ncbi:hypothetical protein CHELA1G11_11103 [Hyphomicrobiales bacterium]|nr:hypothetical protein CHELA1G11_11103 [Hyphomicrobiales bacterium]
MAIVLPARIDRTTVPSPISLSSAGAASSSICGFTASTSTAWGARPSSAGLSARPLAVRACMSGEGCGSMTVIRSSGRPIFSQPSSMAPPILPAPTRRREAGSATVMAEPDRLEQTRKAGRSRNVAGDAGVVSGGRGLVKKRRHHGLARCACHPSAALGREGQDAMVPAMGLMAILLRLEGLKLSFRGPAWARRPETTNMTLDESARWARAG